MSRQLEIKDHPEQAYRVCLGLLNLSREYPTRRLDAACRIANQEGLLRLKQIKSILRSNRDHRYLLLQYRHTVHPVHKLPEQLSLETALVQDHENIRGPRNFH